MKKFLIISAIIFLPGLDVISQTKNFIDQPYIETSAQVDTLITPDKIFLDILITEKDTKGKTSVEELEGRMEQTLKTLGIDTKKQLVLNDLASNFKKYFLKQKDVLKSKAYTLEVSDAQTAGKVILALEENEISNVHLDRTEFSKMDQLKLMLRSKAIIKARRQAAAMCTPLDQRVGAAIYISDITGGPLDSSLQGSVPGIQVRGTVFGYGIEKRTELAGIEFEKIKIESLVRVKFKLLGLRE